MTLITLGSERVNDPPESVPISTTADIFADDTTLSCCSLWSDTASLRSNLCESTVALDKWTKNNRLQLNTSKTKTMLITGKRLRTKVSPGEEVLDIHMNDATTLEQVTSHKLIDLTVDQDLTFDDHIDSTCKNLAKRIGLLRSDSILSTDEGTYYSVLHFCNQTCANVQQRHLVHDFLRQFTPSLQAPEERSPSDTKCKSQRGENYCLVRETKLDPFL